MWKLLLGGAKNNLQVLKGSKKIYKIVELGTGTIQTGKKKKRNYVRA